MDQCSHSPSLQLGPVRRPGPARVGSQGFASSSDSRAQEASPKSRCHEANAPTPASANSGISRRSRTAITSTPVWAQAGSPKSGSPTGCDSSSRFFRAPAPARMRRSTSPANHTGSPTPSRSSLTPQPSFTPKPRSRAPTPMLTLGASVRVRSPSATSLAPTSPTSGAAPGPAPTSPTSGFALAPTSPTNGVALAPTSPTRGVAPAPSSLTFGAAVSPAPTLSTSGIASGSAQRQAQVKTSVAGPAPSKNADTPVSPLVDCRSPGATGTSSILVPSLTLPRKTQPPQGVSSSSPRQPPYQLRRSRTPLVSSSPPAQRAGRYPVPAPRQSQQSPRSAYPIKYPIPTPPFPAQQSPRSPTASPMSSRGPSLVVSSAPTTGAWQRVGTMVKAVQAFAQSASTPAQPPQVTQVTQAARPNSWQRMGNVVKATNAFAQLTQAKGTLQMGLPSTTTRSGGSVHLQMPASRPTTFKFSEASRSAARSSSVPQSAHHQQYVLPVSPSLPSRPTSLPSVQAFQVQHVSPRPEESEELKQPRLATIETGKLLTTGTLENLDEIDQLSARSGAATAAQGAEKPGDIDTAAVEELPPHILETLRNINEMLQDREHLKAIVIKNFKLARQDESLRDSKVTFVEEQIEDAALEKSEFYVFVDLISQAMDLPPYAFGNLELEYVCFDFNGHGSLNIKETYKFVKFHLKQYRRELGGHAYVSVDIPEKTLAQAGYEILEVLGHGNQGFAKLARDTAGNELCLKVFDKKRMRNDHFLDMVDEFESMQLLSCRCVAGASEMFQDSLNYYMACELYRGGDFTQLAENATNQGVDIDEDWYCDLFRQCFEAIKFMHEQAVMHCDIKEANLMLKTIDFSAPEVVVIDLGVSNSLVQSSDEGIPHGTPGYVPPETLETMKWFPPGDIFSMGVVAFQLVTGLTPPERGLFIDGCKSAKEMFRATLEREPDYSMVPAEMPGLRNLLEQLLEKDKDRRPRPSKVLKHYWFSGCDADANEFVQSGELTKNIKEFYKKLAPKHHFATIGFTKSMIQHIQDRDDCADEQETDICRSTT